MQRSDGARDSHGRPLSELLRWWSTFIGEVGTLAADRLELYESLLREALTQVAHGQRGTAARDSRERLALGYSELDDRIARALGENGEHTAQSGAAGNISSERLGAVLGRHAPPSRGVDYVAQEITRVEHRAEWQETVVIEVTREIQLRQARELPFSIEGESGLDPMDSGDRARLDSFEAACDACTRYHVGLLEGAAAERRACTKLVDAWAEGAGSITPEEAPYLRAALNALATVMRCRP